MDRGHSGWLVMAEVIPPGGIPLGCCLQQDLAGLAQQASRGEQLRCHLAVQTPADDCQQIDTIALPARHTSRVRDSDSRAWPGGMHAQFGRDAAHAEWFYDFRLAVRTDPGSRVGAWSIVVAAGQAARGTAVLIPPARDQRHATPPILQKIIAEWRNRIETIFQEITDREWSWPAGTPSQLTRSGHRRPRTRGSRQG